MRPMESVPSALQAATAGNAAARTRRGLPAGPAGAWRQRLLFALNFLRHPLSVGTAFRSSPSLVQRLATGTDWARCRSVVELGPGVGTVTRALLEHMAPSATLLAIETNADFVAELQRTLPDPRLVVVHGSAADLRALLAAQGLRQVDALISGIPFSTLPAPLRTAVLDAVADSLSPGGELVVYQHTALLLPLLQERFHSVANETEWRNFFPMRVFRCRGPRRAA